MPATPALLNVLGEWRTVLGEQVDIGEEATGRELWPVTAEDGARYFLKRLGPWRNLPLADEARVLMHLERHGVGVAGFVPTDRATLFAGPIEELFVLMPRLESDQFGAAGLVSLEPAIGRALAELHGALATYPWPANSYIENPGEALGKELMLPPDIASELALRREAMTAALSGLPAQLIHGDLTPENVLLRRPGEVSGFIDFDHLPVGPRIWDIAKYLSRRIRLRWRGPHGPEPGRLYHIAGFLAGYHRTSPLGAAEIAALPAAIAAGNVLEVSYFMEISTGTLPRRKLPDHDDVLADTVDAARWHLANYQEVTAAVQSSIR